MRRGVGAACRAVLVVASRVVPLPSRRAWREEWLGELWALGEKGAGPPALVRYAAGGVAHAFWERREMEGSFGGLGRDVVSGVRRLRRAPGFTLVTVAVLALGIGANTALYSALRAALLGTSPYPGAARLVMVDLLVARDAGVPADTMPWSYPKFELLRERLASVGPMAGYTLRQHTLTGAGDAARVGVEFVSPAYFGLLGVPPATGRLFHASEEPPAPAAVALLSHALWTTRFGADPGVVGRSVTLDEVSLQVVGVLPAGFAGLTGGADLWVPMAGLAAMGNGRRLEASWAHWLWVVGRLRPGTSLERARDEASALGPALAEAFPGPTGYADTPAGPSLIETPKAPLYRATVVPFLRARVNPVTRLALGTVSAGGLLLLLVACANVAGLFLARASARRGDVAVRAALGAGRGRLVREHLVESLLLAAAGGAAGLLVAAAAERAVAGGVRAALSTSGSRGLQYLDPDALAVDGAVLATGALIALGTGLLFGLLPARATTRSDLGRDLRGGGQGAVGTRPGGERARGLLIVAQIAVTLVLLAGTGLMAASYAALAEVDVGFSGRDVLAVRFDRGPGHPPDEARAFEAALLERLGGMPGVSSAAVGPCPPLTGACEITGIRRIDDGPPAAIGEMAPIVTYAVSDGYFRTLGIEVREGRVFDGTLPSDGPPVAVVNETAARTLFGGSALGRRIAVTHALTETEGAEVVGVVADVRYATLEEEVGPTLYFSRRQSPDLYGTLYVRGGDGAAGLLDAVRASVMALDPELPLTDPTTLADLEAAATARTRVVLGLLAAFSLLGTVLTAVGLYGVVSYAVARRSREMGLRLALGAVGGDVVRLVMSGPTFLAGAGAALGIGCALLLTRPLGALLFGVKPADVRVLVGAAAVLLSVAAVAAWIPARRATRLDPADTLRTD